MFGNLRNIFKKTKKNEMLKPSSKEAAKERLHLVLMQDRVNVSADFLDLMKEEMVGVIKKYIDIDENAMDVRLTTEINEEGLQGTPALYANIPIINIKEETRKLSTTNQDKPKDNEPPKQEEKTEDIKEKEEKVEKDSDTEKNEEERVEEEKVEVEKVEETKKQEDVKAENEDNVEDKEEKKDEK